MSESMFDAVKMYYIFKYVVDSSGNPTDHEGEIQAFVKATDMWEAMDNSGFTDSDLYGANLCSEEHLDQFTKAIAKERKHLSKISKQLKVFTDERDAAQKAFEDERPCPNDCGQLDENFSCPTCGYGHEADDLKKEIDKAIKKAEKKGEDTSELEAMRNALA